MDVRSRFERVLDKVVSFLTYIISFLFQHSKYHILYNIATVNYEESKNESGNRGGGESVTTTATGKATAAAAAATTFGNQECGQVEAEK